MVEVTHKFNLEHEVILKSKLGWHTIYKKLRVEHISPGFIKCSNNVRYAGKDGREIGTSTPDFVYRLDEIEQQSQKTYNEVYEEQKAKLLTNSQLVVQ